MSFPPDLLEMLAAFDAHHVRFLVVGGHAVSLHTRPRTTKDLDIWLDEAPENIAPLVPPSPSSEYPTRSSPISERPHPTRSYGLAAFRRVSISYSASPESLSSLRGHAGSRSP